jgi:pyruvyl transferase EpsO
LTGEGLLPALRERARQAVAGALPATPGPVALLDFPDYANPGDAAIWLGALDVLAASGMPRPAYASDWRTFDERALRRALPQGTILFTGGGNFGDLWPRHQSFRERVIERFPGHAIVQLPQSIHFGSADATARARAVLGSHATCTIMARDQQSADFATGELGCRTVLCPDLALCLTPATEPAVGRDRAVAPAGDVLWLMRSDHESAFGPERAGPGIGRSTVDWVDERPSPAARVARRLGDAIEQRVPGSRVLRTALSAMYAGLARERVRHGCRLLRSARVVITDRLHGHILALLCEVPHVLVGDRYGKVRRFHDTWTAPSPLAHWAGSPAIAADMARDLLAGAAAVGR